MSLKRSDKNTNGNGSAGADAAGRMPKYRDNVEINAKIDAYIQANPKEWAYIQGLPRERLERMLVLQKVNKLERRDAYPRQRDETTRCESRAKGSLSQTREESACRTAGASDDVDRCADAAHHHAASATEQRRASLTKRAAKREDSRLPPGVRRSARPETSRAFFPAMMPLLRSRIGGRFTRLHWVDHGSRKTPSDCCVSINAPESSKTRTTAICERL